MSGTAMRTATVVIAIFAAVVSVANIVSSQQINSMLNDQKASKPVLMKDRLSLGMSMSLHNLERPSVMPSFESYRIGPWMTSVEMSDTMKADMALLFDSVEQVVANVRSVNCSSVSDENFMFTAMKNGKLEYGSYCLRQFDAAARPADGAWVPKSVGTVTMLDVE
ncbi:MAG: hypothetical protein EON60_07000 [Alphaproteobacteria bacterium]|nr:MAG: hypothetical protein EON60_07000 [Alphaproteobacteria bacterium]